MNRADGYLSSDIRRPRPRPRIACFIVAMPLFCCCLNPARLRSQHQRELKMTWNMCAVQLLLLLTWPAASSRKNEGCSTRTKQTLCERQMLPSPSSAGKPHRKLPEEGSVGHRSPECSGQFPCKFQQAGSKHSTLANLLCVGRL